MKREKQRYITFEIISDDVEFSKGEIINAIWKQFTDLFGEYGTSKAGLWLIHYDPTLKRGVLRCSLNSVNKVRASIVTLRVINKRADGNHEFPIIFYVVGVAATILTIKRKYFHVPDNRPKKK